MNESSVHVVLCDDHEIVRDGVRRLLEAFDDIELIASVADGDEAVRATARLRPEVVLMDLSMPGVDGVQAIRRILAEMPAPRVVVLTSFSGRERVLEAIDAGATGYIFKDAAPRDLVQAIRAAARGEAPLDPRAARIVMSGHRRRRVTAEMTEREREVLALLGSGLPNKLIARRLGISQATVKAHLTHIYRQIDAGGRVEAALWARRHGLSSS